VFRCCRDPDPAPPVSGALFFPPGVHHLPGPDGVLQLPPGKDTIVVARGAWVDGRINVTRHATGPVHVVGHGILSGRRYRYHGGAVSDSLRAIEVQYDRPLHVHGPTVVDSKGHALYLPPHSSAAAIKVIGWLYNEDGVWVGPNCTLSQSMVRTNDDSVRLYAGSLDTFANHPAPPRGQPAANIVVQDMTIQQLFNGAVVQIGWEDAGIQNSTIRRLHVVGAEWYTAGENNAVLSLRPPVYDTELTEHHSNLTVEDVIVDGAVGRVLGIGLLGAAAPKASSVRGLVMRKVTVRHKLRWWPTGSGLVEGSNFIVASWPDSISGVRFERVSVASTNVRHNREWNMNVSGNVSDILYFAD
jgi:hypothetical protein